MKRASSIIYLERTIIYLSTTYVKLILLAYSVFLKNELSSTFFDIVLLFAAVDMFKQEFSYKIVFFI